MLLVPGALIGLIGLHLYLIVRLGVTSPPWSKEAAGEVPDQEAPAGRSGLVQPGPRAAGVRRRPEE
jgi:quinol-cytochrome oxidoreductase complex cytochrome b subunit